MELNLFDNKKDSNGFVNKFIEELKDALENMIDEGKNMKETNNDLNEYNLYEERKILLETKDYLPERLYWIPLEKLKECRVFPVFFHEKLYDIPEVTEHFISDERKAWN